MNNLQSVIEHAERQCRQRGIQLTEKRKKVLLSLLQSGRALSAYEIVDYYKVTFGDSLPAITVYRILAFLQDENLVHKLNLANKYVACIHITCDHEHEVPQFLICTECQRVKEVTVSKAIITALQKNVADVGYSLTSPQLEMNCLCGACSKN